MNRKDIAALMRGMAPVVQEAIRLAVEPVQARVELLERQISERADVAQLVVAEVSRQLDAMPKPQNGRDVDPQAVALMVRDEVASAVAALPAPQDGRDVDVAELRRLVEVEIAARIAAIPAAKDGAAGRDGTDVDLEVLAALVRNEVAEAVAALPAATDGVDGRDGQDADPEVVTALVREVVAAAVAALPVAKDGVDGQDGRAGADGRDGQDADQEAIAAFVREEVATAIAALPAAKDGADGADGRDGKDADPVDPAEVRRLVEEVVAALPKPADGKSIDAVDVRDMLADLVSDAVGAIPAAKDGVGLAGALIDRVGELVLTLSDGSMKSLGQVVGQDGRDGVDGKNGDQGPAGFSLDAFDVSMAPDGRTVLLSFSRGDISEVYELGFPAMIYRGVYREADHYVQGDMVTWAGSLWHCDEPTIEKPGEGSKSWTLAAKRGRDGRDGVVKAAAAEGMPVRVPGAAR